MATYYVREQGAVIQKIDQRLTVLKDNKELARIPMHGSVESLNVSVASGICLYETRRQRRS